MKYKSYNKAVPQEKRLDINNKIIHLINNNLLNKHGVTPEVIYNSYTGKGQNHNLQRKDYNNYYEFSQAKKVIEEGEFFSPHNVCNFIIDSLKPSDSDIICDMTAGIGNFCNFVPVEGNMYLNDIDLNNKKIMQILYPHANIFNDDIRAFNPHILFDLIIGNPPFGLKWNINNKEYLSQFYFCVKAQELLKPLGLLCFIVPNSFMNDEFINQGQIDFMNKNFNFICQYDLPVNSFKMVGIDRIESKVMIFRKKSSSVTEHIPYSLNKIDIELTEEYSNLIYEKYIGRLYNERQTLKSKIHLEMMVCNSTKDTDFKEFEFEVRKLLFDIKRTKSIKNQYTTAINYYNQYLTQKKPDNMKFDEWQETMLTKEKVLKRFKTILSGQHKKQVDEVKWVKTNYSIKLKGYSDKTKKYVENRTDKEYSINDLVLNGYGGLDGNSLTSSSIRKLIERKQREYLQQSKDFNTMSLDSGINEWLSNTYLYDLENDTKIYLNNKQLNDTNKALQKHFSYLQWEQGSGKTITGIFQGLYRLQSNSVKNIFVVAPAIAIKNTWSIMLENFNIPFIVINNKNDIDQIKQEQFILVTFGMIIKNERFLKKFIRMNNKKFMLILDEADSISNPNSKRCKSTLNCFRKLPYSLLLSGTSTRNSINEIYPQLELMYNNSINMLSKNEYLYTTDKKTGELKEEINEYYMKPIPAYKKGYETFSSSHVPKKITVFGASKFNQDIFNKDNLKEIIDKTIITRTLKDITGRELYNINQVVCNFNSYELDLYKTILDKFYEMSAEYHINTGDARKNAMFRILAQLNTLLKACSIPHSFKEYKGNEISSKFLKVFDLLERFKNQRVAIGCIRIKTVKLYEYELRKRYPNRKIFVITGNETTLKERRNIVKELLKYPNAILLSTQQALSCSMNIGFIDKVIIPEMQYNDSSMGQYRGRFIRMNSENVTEVYNVLYNKSIENNLLKLILSKEKLNLFMKNMDLNDDEIFEKHGVDAWLFNCLMIKEQDEDGHINITWGEQNII